MVEVENDPLEIVVEIVELVVGRGVEVEVGVEVLAVVGCGHLLFQTTTFYAHKKVLIRFKM